jgi:hypothetical protein
MWPQRAQQSQKFRNALTLLQAGGYAVDIRRDGVVLRAARTGREWLCYTPEDFDVACDFHAWEAMGRAPSPRATAVWTDALPHDPAMQRALNSFYEQGYAVRIVRGAINYVDRRGVNQGFHSRDEFIAGACKLGSEPGGRRSLHRSVLETRSSLERRLVSMEARAIAAEESAAALAKAKPEYEALKAALLVKFDPARGRASPEERARRTRTRAWLLRLCGTIDGAPDK